MKIGVSRKSQVHCPCQKTTALSNQANSIPTVLVFHGEAYGKIGNSHRMRNLCRKCIRFVRELMTIDRIFATRVLRTTEFCFGDVIEIVMTKPGVTVSKGVKSAGVGVSNPLPRPIRGLRSKLPDLSQACGHAMPRPCCSAGSGPPPVLPASAGRYGIPASRRTLRRAGYPSPPASRHPPQPPLSAALEPSQ